MSEERAAIKTPVTTAQFRDALTAAWIEAFGASPSANSIAILCAQSALETNYWKSCVAFNVGNAKSVLGDGRDFCYFRTWERMSAATARLAVAASTPSAPATLVTTVPDNDGMLKVVFEPRHPACRFRAFATLDDGCADYLGMMHARFAGAWTQLLAGDLGCFVHELAAEHYFTASEASYYAGAARVFCEIVAGWLGFQDVASYQSARGLTADGIGGPLTVASMQRDLMSGSTPPEAA